MHARCEKGLLAGYLEELAVVKFDPSCVHARYSLGCRGWAQGRDRNLAQASAEDEGQIYEDLFCPISGNEASSRTAYSSHQN